MKPINDSKQVSYFTNLMSQMSSADPQGVFEFSANWLVKQGWKAVPVESAARIPLGDISRIVHALNGAGCSQCFAIATEPLGEMPACYLLSVDDLDFRELNHELGPFRFLLTDKTGSWAISCTEWYNVFAGQPLLLEAMLGKPIEQARQEYLEFASSLAKHPDELLLKIAKYYATIEPQESA
jgi:hypothetical protein